MIEMTSDLRRLGREQVRHLTAGNLYAFFRASFGVVEPGATFIDAKHYRVLAHALEKVVSGEIRRLLIAIPPRHGKSLLGSVALPCWLLGRDPALKIICASYGEQLSKDFTVKSRELLRSDTYQSIFPDGIASEWPGGRQAHDHRRRVSDRDHRLA